MNIHRRGERMPDTEPEPWLYRNLPVPHYYGDNVRGLLLAAAALMLVGAPFYADDLRAELPFFIAAMLVLVCLAAFTSPRNRRVLIADAAVAGLGTVLFEAWALAAWGSITLLAFALRQAVALLFFFAFYFSGKTVRALVIERTAGEPDDELVSEDDLEDVEREAQEEERETHMPPTRSHGFQHPEDRDD